MLDQNFKPYFGDLGFAIFGNRSVDKLGTPEYGAPEMFNAISKGPFSFETDIYSLGVVFYEIINSTTSSTTIASMHFSMKNGHQNIFIESDFPGYEWMVNMVNWNPALRWDIKTIYQRLSSSIDNKVEREFYIDQMKNYYQKEQPKIEIMNQYPKFKRSQSRIEQKDKISKNNQILNVPKINQEIEFTQKKRSISQNKRPEIKTPEVKSNNIYENKINFRKKMFESNFQLGRMII